MNAYNLILSALKALRKNGFRTFLTMLGIIIGVAAVIVMQSIGAGTEKSVSERISTLGANMIMVVPAAVNNNGVKMSAGASLTLQYPDVLMIKHYSPSVKYLSPMIRSTVSVVYRHNNWKTTLTGVAPEYLAIRDFNVAKGIPFTNDDVKKLNKVCLIGKTIQLNLFDTTGTIDPIGKTIRINSVPFTVIGVLEAKGQNAFGQDQDDLIIAPYSSVKERMTGSIYLTMIFASSNTADDINSAIDQIRYAVRLSHHLPPGATDDFTINTTAEIAQTISGVARTLSVLLACVAAISLLIGGIGIMNIMFVSVTERTREIGTRLAIGATFIDVLLQFLLEAVVLSLAAGVIGIVLGILISRLVTSLLQWETIITPFSIVISFLVCTAIGIFFGFYPARKAARLNPIEALRYE